MPARRSTAASGILTDTTGLLVAAIVHAANIQDRDGAPTLLASIRTAIPWLRHVFADGGYQPVDDVFVVIMSGWR